MHLPNINKRIKNNMIEIQGDHREKIKLYLERMGFKIKLAGG
jgi:translation initiation factor 1